MPTPFISDSNVKRIKLVFSSNEAYNAQGFNLNYNYVRIPGMCVCVCFNNRITEYNNNNNW